MIKFKSHTILHFSPVVDMKLDPTLEGCLQRVFEWANEMGMKGQLVRGLRFVPPEISIGPLVGGQLKCLIPTIEDEIRGYEQIDVPDSILALIEEEAKNQMERSGINEELLGADE